MSPGFYIQLRVFALEKKTKKQKYKKNNSSGARSGRIHLSHPDEL